MFKNIFVINGSIVLNRHNATWLFNCVSYPKTFILLSVSLCPFRRCVPSCLCTGDRVMAAFKGVWTKGFWRAVSGEFLAMLIFVLLSLGSTINWTATMKDSTPSPPDLVLISLCFGLSIATLVQCFSQISGAHINPAVTVAMVATRKLSLAKSIFYLGAQCLGAVVGAAILYGVTSPSVRGNLGVTSVSKFVYDIHECL